MAEHDEFHDEAPQRSSSALMTGLKLVAAAGFLFSAISTLSNKGSSVSATDLPEEHRRLLETSDGIPSYMKPLMTDLVERKKLMEETPPEEVKYWFEYTGPLQVGCHEC
jgi:hypothetical protein